MSVDTVLDRIWLWGHAAGSHTNRPVDREMWGLPDVSAITPADAADYMGIRNCVMVVYRNEPEPPFNRDALALSNLDSVVWSMMGDASTTRTDDGASDLDEVLSIAGLYLNVHGAIMDDFASGTQPRLPVDAVANAQKRLHEFRRPLDLWVVLYNGQDISPLSDHLQFCDVLTFWTMQGSRLSGLEDAFGQFVAQTPEMRRVLGCYMWNYGEKQPMTVEQMEHQCGLGLRWLREGSIEGIIFLASCICDLGLEAVEWTRQWILDVGDKPL
jgi:hypothetical protein